MADSPVLVAQTGPQAGQVLPVPEGGLRFGRAPDNEVVLAEEGVSRYHAKLLYENGTLWVQDLGSRNGIFVNDSRVNAHKALKVGDVLAIAGIRYQVAWADDLPRQPAPPDPGRGRKRWFWPFG